MIYLFTTIYNVQDTNRIEELSSVIKNNQILKAIDKIFILNEKSNINISKIDKIELIPLDNRPFYSDFFKLINKISTPDDINIISNSDIFFDKNIGVLKYILLKETCFSLSRWNIGSYGKPKLFNRNDSQDVWIFKGKINEYVNGNFPLGVPRCDNRFLHELKKAGYKVLNPAFSIKSLHLHKDCLNDYPAGLKKGYIEGPYDYLFPHNQFNLIKTLLFNLIHKEKLNLYKYDCKKINQWIIIRLFRKLLKKVFKYELPLIGYNIKVQS